MPESFYHRNLMDRYQSTKLKRKLNAGSSPVGDAKFVPIVKWISCLSSKQNYVICSYMSKQCTKCKNTYGEPLSDFFNKKSGTTDGYQYSCKRCLRDFHLQHYSERKDYYKTKTAKQKQQNITKYTKIVASNLWLII